MMEHHAISLGLFILFFVIALGPMIGALKPKRRGWN